jgi:hypothetical protein
MMKYLLVFLFAFVTTPTLIAQQAIISPSVPLPPDVENRLSELLRDYRVYDIDTERLQELLQRQDDMTMDIPMDGIDTININVQRTDILSFDYFCSTVSIYKDNYTYKGLITDGEDLRLTIDRNFLYGYFNLGEEQIFFEPLRMLLDRPINDNFFIFYRASDVIDDEARICNAILTADRAEEVKEQAAEAKRMGCFEVKLAIASDREMFDRYDSIDDIEDRNVAIMNNVQGNYTGEFNDDIEFRIVQQVIVTNNSNPFGTQSTTDASTILATFAGWAAGGGFAVDYDLAQLWTATNITFNGNASTIGLAYIPGVCNPIGKFHLLEDIQASAGIMRTLTAHEIGHNFNAPHQNAAAIMAPSLIETNNWTSASKNIISNWIRSSNCQSGATALDACGSTPPPPSGSCPNVVNVSGTASGTYTALQTVQTVGITNVFSTATFRSGNRILLRPGFWARSGSNFSASIDNIGSGECSSGLVSDEVVEERSGVVLEELMEQSLLLVPNPAQMEVQLSFHLVTPSNTSILLFDAQGQVIRQLTPARLDSGIQQLTLDLAGVPSGLYYVIVQHAKGQLVRRLVVSK